jgi:squalene-hopene/tetraprenyl-beta-curcumene cyclase
VHALLARQQQDGHWHEGLNNKVTIDACHLLLHAFLRLPPPQGSNAIARWIRSQQTPTGCWQNFPGGPHQLSTTSMAYLALRMTGDQAGDAHMRAAAAWVRQQGGLAACRGTARLWLALFGQRPWNDVPSIPPELILLPARGPLSIHDLAVWAQATMLPMAVITAYRPVRSPGFDLTELWSAPPAAHNSSATTATRLLAAYERIMPARVRRRALQRIGRWLRDRQEQDGCWGGVHHYTVYSILALHLLGERVEGAVLQRALRGLSAFAQQETQGRTSVRFSHAPVWDTALTVRALQASGSAAADTAVQQGIAWLGARQQRTPGEWSAHRPTLPAGAWAFQYCNRHSPDTDDTAMVLHVLLNHRNHKPGQTPDQVCERELDDTCRRGLDWLAGMACRDGGWAAFDADARVRRAQRLPYPEPEVLADPPSADITAHAVEVLAQAGPRYRHRVRAGVRWLLAAQEQDGSWLGQWGCNYLYGTAAVLTALNAAGVPADTPAVQRATAWFVDHQNSDGGWGEDQRSYQDPQWRGRGPSTASQTAWALSGLLAADQRDHHVHRGITWLLTHQQPSGLWQETQFTGAVFPRDSPIRYGSYSRVFPLIALSWYLSPSTYL